MSTNLSLPRLEVALRETEPVQTKTGIFYEYLTEHELPLTLYVHVVGYGYRTLSSAPMTLTFLSSCCHCYLMAGDEDAWDEEEEVGVCAACRKVQHWAPTTDPLSINDRARTSEVLTDALQQLHSMNPLEAALAAADILLELDHAHEANFGPAWASQKATEVLGITHRMEFRRKV